MFYTPLCQKLQKLHNLQFALKKFVGCDVGAFQIPFKDFIPHVPNSIQYGTILTVLLEVLFQPLSTLWPLNASCNSSRPLCIIKMGAFRLPFTEQKAWCSTIRKRPQTKWNQAGSAHYWRVPLCDAFSIHLPKWEVDLNSWNQRACIVNLFDETRTIY